MSHQHLDLSSLELREDFYLSQLADALDAKNTKIYSHEEAWA